MIESLLESVHYVSSAPFFWLGMGLTVSIGMILGALFFDGDLSQAKKGIVMMLAYIFLLVGVTTPRIMDALARRVQDLSSGRPFASLVTIFFVTIAYFIGIYIGVWYLKYRGVKHERKN